MILFIYFVVSGEKVCLDVKIFLDDFFNELDCNLFDY